MKLLLLLPIITGMLLVACSTKPETTDTSVSTTSSQVQVGETAGTATTNNLDSGISPNAPITGSR